MPRTLHCVAVLTATLLALGGCDSRINAMPDSELQDRALECRGSLDQSPGFAISCDNYRRECLRRREQGKYLC